MNFFFQILDPDPSATLEGSAATKTCGELMFLEAARQQSQSMILVVTARLTHITVLTQEELLTTADVHSTAAQWSHTSHGRT